MVTIIHGIDIKQNHLQKGHWNEVPTWDWAVDVVLKCIMGPFWGTNFDPVSYAASFQLKTQNSPIVQWDATTAQSHAQP